MKFRWRWLWYLLLIGVGYCTLLSYCSRPAEDTKKVITETAKQKPADKPGETAKTNTWEPYAATGVAILALYLIINTWRGKQPSASASAPADTQTTVKSGGWLRVLLTLAIFGAVIYWFGNKIYEAEMASRGGKQANTVDNAVCSGDPAEVTFGPGRPEKVRYAMTRQCWSPEFNAELFDQFHLEGVDNKGYHIRFFRDGYTEWVAPYDGTNCVWFGSQDTAPPECKLVGNHGNRFRVRGEGPLIVWVEKPLFTRPTPSPKPVPAPTPEPTPTTPITE